MKQNGWEYIDKSPSDPITSLKFSEIQGYSKDGRWIGGIAKISEGKWGARGWKYYGESFPDPFSQIDFGEFEDEQSARFAVEKWASNNLI